MGEVTEITGRKPYATWEVGGNTYKLKLRTSDVEELESVYKTNLMNVMGIGESGMPALRVMLDVTHKAMQRYHHGVKRKDLPDIFDDYLDEGGSQLEFYTTTYMAIFQVSGFFSDKIATDLTEKIDEISEDM